MIRWVDLIGLAGLALVVFGALLLFPSSQDNLNWKYMLGGALLWLVGFASVVGWLLLRWSVRPSPEESCPRYDKAA